MSRKLIVATHFPKSFLVEIAVEIAGVGQVNAGLSSYVSDVSLG